RGEGAAAGVAAGGSVGSHGFSGGLRARPDTRCPARRGDTFAGVAGSPRWRPCAVSASNQADSSPMPATSEARDDDMLMSAYARGEAAAFETLYARHQAGLYRFVRRLLGTALAAQTDEVFQDTWLRVVHSRTRWDPQGATFRTWLYTLAHHRVIDLLRRSGREVALDAFEGEDGEPWQPDAAAWQHWPAPAAAAPHQEELVF